MQGHQLRVRITAKHRTQLLAISSGRRQGETLSDIVREAIEAYLKPKPPQVDPDFVISKESQCHVRKLAKHLDRSPRQVIEDCVDGVIGLFEQQKPPLIVLELELRAKYFARRGDTPRKGSIAERLPDSALGSPDPT